MADMIKFFKGLEASLPAAGANGALYITTDEGAIYLGTGTGMKRLGDFVQVAKVSDLPAKAHESCLYYCVAENILAKWNGTEWKQINKQPTIAEIKEGLELGALADLDKVAEDNLDSALKEKVNAAAEGNHAHANKDVLDGITAENIAAWDAAEQNAKDYTDDLETYIFDGDGDHPGLWALYERGHYLGAFESWRELNDSGINAVIGDTAFIAPADGAPALYMATGAFVGEWSEDGELDSDRHGALGFGWTCIDGTEVIEDMYTNDQIDDFIAAAKKYADDNDADTKYGIAYDSDAKKIKLVEGGTTLEIDATAFIKDGMIQSVELVDENGAGHVGSFLKIVWNTDADVDADDVTYVDLADLVDVYTGSNGTTVDVAVSNQNVISASVHDIKDAHIASDAAIAKSKLAADVQASLGKADSALQSHQDISHLATKTELDNVDKKFGDYTTTEALTTLLSHKQDTIPANTYDAYGAAATAKSEAIADAATKYLTDVQIQAGSANGTIKYLTQTGTSQPVVSDDIAIPGLTDTAFTASSEFVKKAEATGYDDILTKTAAQTAYQPKGDYATKAQGDKADTAVQSVYIGSLEADMNGTNAVFAVADVKTELGLGTAAYTEASDYAKVGDVYAKTETYTKTEVDAAIAAAVETAHTWGTF